jgi:membrane-anchored protein YejM (alkaline phosphatase superfamily)
MGTNVSEEHSAAIFRVKVICLLDLRWLQHVPLKRSCLPTRLYGVITQVTIQIKLDLIELELCPFTAEPLGFITGEYEK